jgi:predicted O-linked N-acetylglucosamine transferase (SPINDLY family)
LRAIGVEELISTSIPEYEALAIQLARDPAMLHSLKAKLATNRQTHSLFDTQSYCCDLETAFATMWERHRRGEKPAGFAVEGTNTP